MGVYDERIIRATKFEYADIINRVRPIHKADRFSISKGYLLMMSIVI